jgi:hypothetical protein
MGRSSQVTEKLTTAFVARFARDERGRCGESPARALVRARSDLAARHARESDEEERELVERFVGPALL